MILDIAQADKATSAIVNPTELKPATNRPTVSITRGDAVA